MGGRPIEYFYFYITGYFVFCELSQPTHAKKKKITGHNCFLFVISKFFSPNNNFFILYTDSSPLRYPCLSFLCVKITQAYEKRQLSKAQYFSFHITSDTSYFPLYEQLKLFPLAKVNISTLFLTSLPTYLACVLFVHLRKANKIKQTHINGSEIYMDVDKK